MNHKNGNFVLKFHFLFVVALSVVSIPSAIFAANWEFSSKEVHEIILTGLKAQVVVNAVSADSPISLFTGDSSHASTTTSSNIVNPLQSQYVKNTLYSYWNTNVANGVLLFQGAEQAASAADENIHLALPAGVKLKIVLNSGKVQLGAQVGKVFVRLLQGQVNAFKTQDNLQIFIQKGDVLVEDHFGNVDIESYQAHVVVKNNQGSVDLVNFMGESNIEKPFGHLNLQSKLGNGRIASPQSGVHFQLGRGQLTATEVSSRFEGGVEEGSLVVTALPDSEIDVQAGKGRVQVQLPPQSGALLNLKTISGELVAPSPLKVARDSKYKIVKGRLNGTQKGLVVIRGDDASVVVK